MLNPILAAATDPAVLVLTAFALADATWRRIPWWVAGAGALATLAFWATGGPWSWLGALSGLLFMLLAGFPRGDGLAAFLVSGLFGPTPTMVTLAALAVVVLAAGRWAVPLGVPLLPVWWALVTAWSLGVNLGQLML